MQRFLFGPVLGLAIFISGLTVGTSANAFTLHNYQTGLCLGVAAGNPNPGAALVTWPCDGTPSQQWGYNSRGAALPPPPSNGSYLGWYLISSVNPQIDEYLTAGYISTQLGGRSPYITNGSPVFVTKSANAIGLNEQWEMWWATKDSPNHDSTRDCYIVESRADYSNGTGIGPPTVMGVSGGNPNKGTAVIMWNQLFNSHGAPDFAGHPDQYWCVYQ